MATKKDTIKLKEVSSRKSVGEKKHEKREITLPFAHALKVMQLQEKKGRKAWEVSEPNYKFQNGEINYTGGKENTQKATS